MEIRKELQDFLNDEDVLNLIADQDWRELFSKAEINIPYDISALHKILVKSGLTFTYSILQSLDHIPARFCEDFGSLTSITIPNKVTSIGDDAFRWCTSLTSITIPDNVTSIGMYAFQYCSKLTDIVLPNNITDISQCMFFECSSLTSITIPDSVTNIEFGAFIRCSSLTSITIPDGVTSIPQRAFESCSSLTSVTLSNNITKIDQQAFYNCTKLKTIYFKGTEDQWEQVKKAKNWKSGTRAVKIIFKG